MTSKIFPFCTFVSVLFCFLWIYYLTLPTLVPTWSASCGPRHCLTLGRWACSRDNGAWKSTPGTPSCTSSTRGSVRLVAVIIIFNILQLILLQLILLVYCTRYVNNNSNKGVILHFVLPCPMECLHTPLMRAADLSVLIGITCTYPVIIKNRIRLIKFCEGLHLPWARHAADFYHVSLKQLCDMYGSKRFRCVLWGSSLVSGT